MITTRFTERFGLQAPIASAPMAFAAGGQLAAAVGAAGGLGLIGGGYGDPAFLENAFRTAGNTAVGCGFITWRLAENRALLTAALSHQPRAMMLSFGDPAPYCDEIAAAGVPLICQVQTMAHVDDAMAAGADVIVAQGSEAGGHGATRATMTLVPEVCDAVGESTIVLAAGGIADGRGLAAALALGADGVLMGSRFWAAREALTHPRHQAAAVDATGDATIRQRATDIARGYDWPAPFTARVLNNAFVQRWEGRAAEHCAVAEADRPAYAEALARGDPQEAGVFVGEATGLIADVASAADIIERTTAEAERIMKRSSALLI